MEISMLVSFVLYSFVTSVTPGPNNIMLTASGLNFGLRRSLPHILGIGFGFGLMVAIVGLGVGSILSSSKHLYEAIRIVGIAYLLYLAYKIANAGVTNMDGDKAEKPLGFLGAALFQWVNPKAWIMTMGAVTAYTSADSPLSIFLLIGLIYGAVSIPSVGVWAYMGEKLQGLIGDAQRVRWFNIFMAALLVISMGSSIKESAVYFYSLFGG